MIKKLYKDKINIYLYSIEMVDKIKCVFCNKSIRKFKVRTDWGKRKAHLTCWKEDSDWGYLKKYRYWKDRPENKIAQI